MNEWISVKDRLPEENGQYLCVWHYLHEGDKDFMDCLNFWDGAFPWENFGSGHVVTHWMLLPEPPKED